MPLKRVVTSAVLVVLGCADVPTDSPDLPPYGGGNWATDTAGTPSANQPANTAGDTAAEGNVGVNGPAAGDSRATNEDPNANLPIAANAGDNAGSNTGTNTGSAAPPAQDGTGQTDGMTAGTGQTGTGQTGTGQNGNGQTGTGQTGTGQNGNGTQATPPPPPPPPPRPALDCNSQPTLTGGTQACTVNAGGTIDGQNWFMWYSGSGGCITTFPQGGFKATWNNSGDFLARSGLQFDETKTFDQYGTIGADMAFTKTGTGGNYSFIGIYGWSNNPLVEYYIVENSFQNGVTTPYGTTQRGQFTVDGATYRVYTGTKQNQPSIHGNANFQQFFSVRQTPRTCGHISISEHFKAWAGMGMTLGKMYESKILVEAGGGSGSINFTTAYVSASAGSD